MYSQANNLSIFVILVTNDKPENRCVSHTVYAHSSFVFNLEGAVVIIVSPNLPKLCDFNDSEHAICFTIAKEIIHRSFS